MNIISDGPATYSGVRALERGLDLLHALALAGRASPARLADMTGIDRTTVYRLLDTMRRKEYVTLHQSDRTYGLTLAIKQLGDGFTHLDDVCRAVAPEMGNLLTEVTWPSDYASFERGAMVIRESTHRFSPFSIHRAMVGRTRPLTRSALGRAVLSSVKKRERDVMLRLAVETDQPDAADASTPVMIRSIVSDFAKRGYAWSVDGSEKGISAIALPLHSGDRVVGALNMVFFTRAMSPEEAARRYLPALQTTIGAVEKRLDQMSR